MAGELSPYVVNRVIDFLFRGDSTDVLPGASLYLALLSAPPYQIGAYLYFDADVEAAYSGYARRTYARSLTGFRSTQGDTSVSSGDSGTITAAPAYFPVCATAQAFVATHVALTDELSRYSTENFVIAYWTLDRPIDLSRVQGSGLYPSVPPNALKLRMQ